MGSNKPMQINVSSPNHLFMYWHPLTEAYIIVFITPKCSVKAVCRACVPGGSHYDAAVGFIPRQSDRIVLLISEVIL